MAVKTDMERMGVFSELGYTTIKDPYASAYAKPFNVSASKNKQFTVESTKPKSAFQDGYFSGKFGRVMEGEAYSDMVKMRRQQRVKANTKNLAGPYVPPPHTKPISGLGSSYGTLSGPVKAFSAATKPRPKYKSPGKNVVTNPGKKGTGYGYNKITIGPLPKYESDPFDRAQKQRLKDQKVNRSKQKDGAFLLHLHPKDYFLQNPYRADKPLPPAKDTEPKKESLKPFRPSHPPKMVGGCKAGTFDRYPKHSEDEFIMPKFGRPGLVKTKMKGGVFKPSQDLKSTPTVSVVQRNVMRTMNIGNFRAMAATV